MPPSHAAASTRPSGEPDRLLPWSRDRLECFRERVVPVATLREEAQPSLRWSKGAELLHEPGPEEPARPHAPIDGHRPRIGPALEGEGLELVGRDDARLPLLIGPGRREERLPGELP